MPDPVDITSRRSSRQSNIIEASPHLWLYECVCGNNRIIAAYASLPCEACMCEHMADVSLADFLAAHPNCEAGNLRRAIVYIAAGISDHPLRNVLCEVVRAWEPDNPDHAELKAIVLSDRDEVLAKARDADPWDYTGRRGAVPKPMKYSLKRLETWLQAYRSLCELRELLDEGLSFNEGDL